MVKLRTLYWKIRQPLDEYLPNMTWEKRWRSKKFLLNDCWGGTNHAHRKLLVDKISNFSPISSIFEFGCNYGPNLYLLAKRFPGANIEGVDINPSAIQRGIEWFAQEKISNVRLAIGDATNLTQFKDKSFDVVITDAVMMYICKKDIQKVLGELVRLARKALILVEWQYNSTDKNHSDIGTYYLGKWKRNYINLLKQFVPEKNIHITKLPEEVCPDENWKKLGYMIEAVI